MQIIRLDSGYTELEVTDFITAFRGPIPRQDETIIHEDKRYYVNLVEWRVAGATNEINVTVYVRPA